MKREELNRSFSKLSPSEKSKERMLEKIEEKSQRKERPSFKMHYVPIAVAFLVILSVGVAGLIGNLTSREAMREANYMAVAEESAQQETDTQILSATRSEYHRGEIYLEDDKLFVNLMGEPLEIKGIEVEEGEYLFEVITIKNPFLREDILSLYPIIDNILGKAVIMNQEDLEGSSVDLFLE